MLQLRKSDLVFKEGAEKIAKLHAEVCASNGSKETFLTNTDTHGGAYLVTHDGSMVYCSHEDLLLLEPMAS